MTLEMKKESLRKEALRKGVGCKKKRDNTIIRFGLDEIANGLQVKLSGIKYPPVNS